MADDSLLPLSGDEKAYPCRGAQTLDRWRPLPAVTAGPDARGGSRTAAAAETGAGAVAAAEALRAAEQG
jgi:hypothetical protein